VPIHLRRLGSALLLPLVACAGRDGPAAGIEVAPQWSWDASLSFPRDSSLTRPEDGVALPDGRLIVADQVHGLRLVEPDGASRPFGDLPAKGYRHQPPAFTGGANGVALEPDGTHLLLADVFGAAIYRVDVTTGNAEKVYQHDYGINTAVRDSRGTIWFSQSAHNPPGDEAMLWASVDIQQPLGALFRLPAGASAAERVVDSLYFANGIALDEPNGQLYLAETTGGRILRFRVDWVTGALSERTVFVDSVSADNLELDGDGNLWIAVPLRNEVLVVDTRTGSRRTAFRSLTPEQEQVVAEFERRGRSGESRMALFTPAAWTPLSAPITGVILGPPGSPVYLTGLGNALLRLPRP
jgi:sugar lactone lactonase YvrE